MTNPKQPADESLEPDDRSGSGILSVVNDTTLHVRMLPGPAPRNVPIALQARIYFGSSTLQAAWLLLAFSMLGVWWVLPSTDMTSWYHFGPGVSTVATSGQVKRVEPTRFSVQRANTGESLALQKVSYTYTGIKGSQAQDISYEGVAYSPNGTIAPGDTLAVEYLESNPARSRVPGELIKPIGPHGALMAVIPAICLFVILLSMAKSFRQIRLLSHGELAMATLKHVEPVTVKHLKTVHYRHTVQFIAKDGKRYKSRFLGVQQASTEADSIPIIYSPANPKRSGCMLDMLPGNPVITSDGKLNDFGGGIYYLIIPLLTFIINLVAGIWVMTNT